MRLSTILCSRQAPELCVSRLSPFIFPTGLPLYNPLSNVMSHHVRSSLITLISFCHSDVLYVFLFSCRNLLQTYGTSTRLWSHIDIKKGVSRSALRHNNILYVFLLFSCRNPQQTYETLTRLWSHTDIKNGHPVLLALFRVPREVWVDDRLYPLSSIV